MGTMVSQAQHEIAQLNILRSTTIGNTYQSTDLLYPLLETTSGAR
jgi:hypothetical protein